MSDTRLILLGWNAHVDHDKLKHVRVSFQRGYSMDLLRQYVYDGDYRSDAPFGLYEREGRFYVAAERIPSFIYVHFNPARFHEDAQQPTQHENLSTYVLSTIYQRLADEGYERPVDVKSFVGRVKGLASLRRAPVHCVDLNTFESSLRFCVNEAESFTCLSAGASDLLVLYSPRHEISEASLGLSAANLIPPEVRKHESMKRSIGAVSKRFDRVSSIIADASSDGVRLRRLAPMPAIHFERPLLTVPRKVGASRHETSSQVLEDVMLKNWEPTERMTVQLLVDMTGRRNAVMESASTFAARFEEHTGITPEIRAFETLKAIEQTEGGDAVILLLDSTTPGHEFIYNTVKKNLDIASKVVTLEALQKDQMDRVIFAVYQSLKTRISNKLHQRVTDAALDRTVALRLTPLRKGAFLILSGISLSGTDIAGLSVLLENDWSAGTPTEDEILDFVTKLAGDSLTDRTLVITDDRVNIAKKVRVLSSTHNWALAVVDVVDCVMLEERNGNTEIPRDGSYVVLSDGVYLVMTNGKPERYDEGIPEPIRIEIITPGVYSNEEIARGLFEQTFVHPASLSKPKLPLAMHACGHGVPEERLLRDWTVRGVFL